MDATFSHCARYRYELVRSWALRPSKRSTVTFIGLNPSTADGQSNDPTIRRCIRFAMDWQFNQLIVVNLFGWCATDPANLKAADKPIGAKNDDYINKAVKNSSLVVACWGVHGTYMNRALEIRQRHNKRLHCIRLNKSGQPAHPLYLPAHLSAIKLRSTPQMRK